MFPWSSLKLYKKWYTWLFSSIIVHIHGFDSYNRVHRDVCIVQIFLEFSLTWIRLIWLLAFHMPWDRSDSTLHYPFWSYIRNPLVHWRHIERLKQRNYSPLLQNLYLSLHPFVPWSTVVFFPSFPFASKLAIERWRIEVVEAQVGDSVSPVHRRAVRGCIYLVVSDLY